MKIPKHFGHGGSGLIPSGSSEPTLKRILDDVSEDFVGVKPATLSEAAMVQNACVLDGGIVTDPTTPSEQLTGTGNTTWSVDVAAGRWKVNDVEADVAASADEAIHSGSKLFDNGQSCYAWAVIAESGGSLAIASVKGTPATTGAQVVPTDAEITTGIGHANWTKAALCLLNRTGDTAVTQSQDNSYREPMFGPLALALVNAIRSGNNSKAGYTILTTKEA